MGPGAASAAWSTLCWAPAWAGRSLSMGSCTAACTIRPARSATLRSIGEGDLCACGCRGCVETFVSGPALARRYLRLLERAGARSTLEPVTGETVAHLAREGDDLARADHGRGRGGAWAWRSRRWRWCWTSTCLCWAAAWRSAADLLLEPARRTLPTCSYASVSARTRIEVTELWGDGPILGCGWLARQGVSRRGVGDGDTESIRCPRCHAASVTYVIRVRLWQSAGREPRSGFSS